MQSEDTVHSPPDGAQASRTGADDSEHLIRDSEPATGRTAGMRPTSGDVRGLSLTQPYATLISCGAKKIETRSWATSWRGIVAIHAAKGFPQHCRDLMHHHPRFTLALRPHGYTSSSTLPTGAIVAVARLTQCEATSFLDERGRHRVEPWVQGLTDDERAFGDFSYGRYGWRLEDVRPLPEPIPCRGALGLFRIPDDVEQAIRQQIGTLGVSGER